MGIENSEFWTTFAQTAATLAGFTLAGFSITAASADRLESDGICQRYGLREKSSFASWAFVFLVLMLFFFPLLLSLELLLVVESAPELLLKYRWIVPLVLVLFFLLAGGIICVEMRYINRLISFNMAEKRFNEERGATKLSQGRLSGFLHRLNLSRVGRLPRLWAILLLFLIPFATLLWVGGFIAKPFLDDTLARASMITYPLFSTITIFISPELSYVLYVYRFINCLFAISHSCLCLFSCTWANRDLHTLPFIPAGTITVFIGRPGRVGSLAVRAKIRERGSTA